MSQTGHFRLVKNWRQSTSTISLRKRSVYCGVRHAGKHGLTPNRQPIFRLNSLVIAFPSSEGASHASHFCLFCSANARACDARYGCYGTEFSRARRCGWCYHWRCSRRATRRRNRGRHGRRCGSPSQQAWPLLLASWSLLGAHRRKIASRICSLLQVTNTHALPIRSVNAKQARPAGSRWRAPCVELGRPS
jgi:hypothetical protein